MIFWLISTAVVFIVFITVFKAKTRETAVLLLLNLISLIIMRLAFDNQVLIIKGYLFAQILIFTAWRDMKTREIPNTVHLLISLTALLNINLIGSVLGLVIVPLPFILSAILKEGSIGGGDIKLMAVGGFLLGASAGLSAAVAGLTLAIIVNLAKGNKSGSFALAPYLAVGCIAAYTLFYGRIIT